MATYLITYDLTVAGQQWVALTQALRTNGAVEILLSVWLEETSETEAQVRDKYDRHIDTTDRIFVCRVEGCAFYNIMNEPAVQRMIAGAGAPMSGPEAG